MVSISGIRGVVGSDLTPEVVVRYASAFAEYCNRGTIVIGRDGRITGKNVGNILASTLLQMGCEVLAIGICPTPTVALAVEKKKAAGGISITASHNPMQWNGLKFFASTGLFLDGEENQELWKIAGRPSRAYMPWDHQGTHTSIERFIDDHLQTVLSLPYMQPRKIKERKLKVVLDCVNAAGGVIVPKLLKTLGCRVIPMNCDVSGVFTHTPEPVPENLSALCSRVRIEKADLGIAVDPDVDRLVLIDERGEPFGEEYTIASVVKFVLEKESAKNAKSIKKNPSHKSLKNNTREAEPVVVVNLSTTRAVDDIAKTYGARVVRTPVGEINVAKKMKEIGAIVGGEGSGGVILPSAHLGRDAMVGIGLILQCLTDFRGTVSQFKQTMPQYFIAKGKVESKTPGGGDILTKMMEKYSRKETVNSDDGLKIDFADSWVHLRKSNTEPVIRIIAEAPTKAGANELLSAFTKEILILNG